MRSVVGSIRAGLTELFALPDGYEVLLGNGGSTVFWDAAAFGLVEQRAEHLVFGEFSSKFAARHRARRRSSTTRSCSASEPGTHPELVADATVDTYAYPHNETSTGVMTDVRRPGDDGLVLVDAHVGRGRAAASSRPSSTSTTSRRRSASPATAGSGSRCAPRPPSSASSGSARPGGGCRRR